MLTRYWRRPRIVNGATTSRCARSPKEAALRYRRSSRATGSRTVKSPKRAHRGVRGPYLDRTRTPLPCGGSAGIAFAIRARPGRRGIGPGPIPDIAVWGSRWFSEVRPRQGVSCPGSCGWRVPIEGLIASERHGRADRARCRVNR